MEQSGVGSHSSESRSKTCIYLLKNTELREGYVRENQGVEKEHRGWKNVLVVNRKCWKREYNPGRWL